MAHADDPHDLSRFLEAQERTYDEALAEIRDGHKRSHWMWFIFPQLAGLGWSPTAARYGIRSLAEARAYLRHPTLGPRLVEIANVALSLPSRSAAEIFGSPDDLKLRSCATLFATVSDSASVFHRLLDKYFDGQPDPKTRELLRTAVEPNPE